MIQSFSKNLMEVNDELVQSIELYSQLPWFMRWDLAPFVVAYTILFISVFSSNNTIKVSSHYIYF